MHPMPRRFKVLSQPLAFAAHESPLRLFASSMRYVYIAMLGVSP
jgi:hypothetical protein